MGKIDSTIIIEGHVQGLSNARSIGELGIPVYIIDKVHCIAKYSKYCKSFGLCPDFKSEEFISYLISFAERNRLKNPLLIPSNDHIVENISKHYSLLQGKFTFFVPREKNLYNIIDKSRLLEVAQKCGVNVPKTCYIDNISESQSFRFPLLVKGNLGLSFYKATHSKAIEARNYYDLSNIVNLLPDEINRRDVMIQELIPFDPNERVLSFTCFAQKGEIKSFWVGRKLREHPIKYGTGTCAISVLCPELLEQATPLIKSLEYDGVCEIEFMKDIRDGKYYLIEINPRTWLWIGLAKTCGIDYAKMLYHYGNGDIQKFPDSYPVGIIWKNSFTDLIYGIKGILNGHLKIGDFLSTFGKKDSPAIWSWKDILPGLIFPFMSIYIYNKRR